MKIDETQTPKWMTTDRNLRILWLEMLALYDQTQPSGPLTAPLVCDAPCSNLKSMVVVDTVTVKREHTMS
jgi:hypothetical protein